MYCTVFNYERNLNLLFYLKIMFDPCIELRDFIEIYITGI